MSYDFEDPFYNRKDSRKERKRIQDKDRSKYKKSDQAKKETSSIDTSLKRGRVVSIAGDGFWIESGDERFLASLQGHLKKERLTTKTVLAVGDYVRLTEDNSIAQIEERTSFLARTDIRGVKEQLMAVNVDQAIIVVSIVNPPLKPALIDRYLIASAKGHIHPIIVINKIDLLKTATEEDAARYRELVTAYEQIGLPILSVSTVDNTGLEALRSLVKDKTSVFAGQSGVGKSSLLNSCFGLELKTGGLTQKTSKGSHTTTTAELLPLPGGGYCVDTPGIRSFGLWKLQKQEVIDHFYEFIDRGCKYPDCHHIKEPDCAVLKALEEGKVSSLRYESYRTLLDEALGGKDNWTKRKESDEFD